MNRVVFSALWSHWRSNPVQLFALLVGLALSTALWSGVQAINSEARASYDAAAAILGEGQFDQLIPRTGDRIAEETYIALRRAGWQAGPVIEGRLRLDDRHVRIVGIDPLTAPGGVVSVTQAGDAPLPVFIADRVVFANPDVALALAELVPYRVIADAGIAPRTALTDIGVAQSILRRPGELSRLLLAKDQALGIPPLSEVVPELVRQPSQQSADIGQLTDSFHLNLTAFGLLSFAVGIFLVHGAIGLSFEQRRGMVRTLRALGVPLSRLVVLLSVELFLIAVFAGVIGVVLGYFVAAGLLPDVAATLEGLYGAQVSGAMQLRLSWWLSGLGIALLGTFLAAASALWRIAHMPLLASAGGRAWATVAGHHRRIQFGFALALLALSGLLVVVGSGLVMGFAALACLLLGAALALPSVLDRALRIGENFGSSVRWEWFWADTRQQLPSLSLALMALLLAMAANIGVSTMVSSFRLTFTGFLDQRLASELYVNVTSPEEAARLEVLLAKEADAVLPLFYVDTTLANRPGELYGARVGATYEENWIFLAQEGAVWEEVAAGRAVIVNEQLARRAGLWVGDELDVTRDLALPILGVVGDYGNPIGQAVIGEELFKQLFPMISATRFGVRSSNPDELRNVLIQEFGLTESQIIDQEALKRFSLEVFERTFTITAALNVLTLAVAGFSILMSLLTLASLRIPQLAPAWALGFTRRELGRLELLRALVLANLTLLIALPLGLALAWVLLAVVNVEAFGWRLPMFLFPRDYAALSFFAVMAAFVASIWPAHRLSRTPPSDLLKVFANDR